MRNSKRSHLVVGFGEVGRAIYNVLSQSTLHDSVVSKIDIGESVDGKFDFIHICFPYSGSFVNDVLAYKKKYEGLVVIHSTVPVGTSSSLGAVHSPVRGKHPDLMKSVLTFVKYFGGKDADKASIPFRDAGVTVHVVEKSETTEALKLWDTTQYGWNIILEKFIHGWCQLYKVDFDTVYTHANETYNDGYEKMGLPNFKKFILKHSEGKIGGHCVVQNCKLLDSSVARFIEMADKNIK